MKLLEIAGLDTYLPQASVDNEHLSPLDPPMSIEQMDSIGVLRRGHASAEESVEAMATCAAKAALAQAKVNASELDFILLVNWSSRRYVPDLAPKIQSSLGASRAFAYDICCACCGFIYALGIAVGYLQQPRFNLGLIVTADRSAAHMRPGTRATLIFGDGASAAVVRRAESDGILLRDYEVRTDGSQNGIMEVDSEGYLLPHIRQRELNALASKSMKVVSEAVLDRNQLTLDDIDWIVPHSGSPGIQTLLQQHLGVSADRVLTTLPIHGNLAATAIPCALRYYLEAGTIRPGERILAASVGLGWQYAAMILECSKS